MPYSKSFARNVKGSSYPKWEEITISGEEEAEQERLARIENIELMKECIDDAKGIVESRQLQRYQSDMVNIAIALFEKRASHHVYYKEKKAKEKFDKMYK